MILKPDWVLIWLVGFRLYWKQTYQKVMDDFYRPFIRDLEGVEKKSAAIKESLQESTEEQCEVCGKDMIIKWGRNGRFMACSGYPKCKTTKPLPGEQEQLKHLCAVPLDLCNRWMPRTPANQRVPVG